MQFRFQPRRHGGEKRFEASRPVGEVGFKQAVEFRERFENAVDLKKTLETDTWTELEPYV